MNRLTNLRVGWGLAVVLALVVLGGVVLWQPVRVRHSHIVNLDICTVEGPDERYPMGFCVGCGIVVEWRWSSWH